MKKKNIKRKKNWRKKSGWVAEHVWEVRGGVEGRERARVLGVVWGSMTIFVFLNFYVLVINFRCCYGFWA